MWNVIPQLFYDLVARIVPGATIIVVGIMVVRGPMESLSYFEKNRDILSLGLISIVVLVSYLIGFFLGPFGKKVMRVLGAGKSGRAEQDKQKYLEEYKRLLRAMGREEPEINAEDLPPVYMMRDHFRHIVPADAARLLKVRGEGRMAEVLLLGFIVLSLVNLVYIGAHPKADRVVLGILLFVGIWGSWLRASGLKRHYAAGTIVSWLYLLSTGRLFGEVSCNKKESDVETVTFRGTTMSLKFRDGRRFGVEVSRFPWLLNASPAQRKKYSFRKKGGVLWWDDPGAGICVEALLLGRWDEVECT